MTPKHCPVGVVKVGGHEETQAQRCLSLQGCRVSTQPWHLGLQSSPWSEDYLLRPGDTRDGDVVFSGTVGMATLTRGLSPRTLLSGVLASVHNGVCALRFLGLGTVNPGGQVVPCGGCPVHCAVLKQRPWPSLSSVSRAAHRSRDNQKRLPGGEVAGVEKP